jgi:hypothetical protein
MNRALRPQPAAAHALHAAEDDELQHALRRAGQQRAREEHDDRDLEQDLSSVDVAELAVQRHRGRGCQQVGRDHPRQVLQTPELADDRRQRGGHDRLVERRQQHAEHQPAEHDQDLAM